MDITLTAIDINRIDKLLDVHRNMPESEKRKFAAYQEECAYMDPFDCLEKYLKENKSV